MFLDGDFPVALMGTLKNSFFEQKETKGTKKTSLFFRQFRAERQSAMNRIDEN
jgi:hypothetical protein